MPERRVGWQPSRFLADRGEAERALRWWSGWAVSTPPLKSWGPPGRRCARRSPATALGCPHGTPRRSGSARSTRPASARAGRPRRGLTRCLWRSTTASFRSGLGRVGSWPSGCAGPRTTRSSAPRWWWSCTPRVTRPSPAPAPGRSPAAPTARTVAVSTVSSAPTATPPTSSTGPTSPRNGHGCRCPLTHPPLPGRTATQDTNVVVALAPTGPPCDPGRWRRRVRYGEQVERRPSMPNVRRL
jgi:hypothetical protein